MSNKTHWVLDDDVDPYEDIGIEAEASAQSASVEFRFDGDLFSITGPTADVLTVLTRAFHLLRRETDRLGPECSVCGGHGVLNGSFAVAVGHGHHVHLGCAEDENHERDRHLAAVPD